MGSFGSIVSLSLCFEVLSCSFKSGGGLANFISI